MTVWPAVRMRSSRLGPHTLPAATAQPASQDTQGTTLSGTREEHQPSAHRRYLYIISSPLFLQALSIVPPFLTIFQTGSGLFYDECL